MKTTRVTGTKKGDVNHLAVIVPAYNEEPHIKKLVQQILNLNIKHLIIVDDGSTDQTSKIIQSFQNQVTLIQLKNNQGKEAALKAGFLHASSLPIKKVITLDGDLQHDPQFIPQMCHLLDSFDLVIGSRWGKMPLQRRFSNGLIRLIYRVFGKLDIHDIQSGYRGYKIELIKKLPPQLSGQNRFAVEHAIIAALYPIKIAELTIPNIHLQNRKSHIGINDILQLFFKSFGYAKTIRQKS